MNEYDNLVCELIKKMTADGRKALYETLRMYYDFVGFEMKQEPCLKEHCPLCGGKLVIKRTIDDKTWLATCDGCGKTGLFGHREDGEDLPTPGTLEYGRELREEEDEVDEEDEGGCDDCDCDGDCRVCDFDVNSFLDAVSRFDFAMNYKHAKRR